MGESRFPSRAVGLLAFEGVAGVDLVGVLDAFATANAVVGDGQGRRYDTIVVGLDAAPMRTEAGLRLSCDVVCDAAPAFDTLVTPGGAGLRGPATLTRVAAFLAARSGTTRRMVSVCTGLYGLAAAGLMTGRRATTHWRHAGDFARRHPDVKLQPDALYVRDGKFYSSAGMTAGVDLALALIEEDHGPSLALAVARQLVVYMRRQGGQLQYSEPLRLQTQAGDRFQDLVGAIAADLTRSWTSEVMAERAGLGVRQFTRAFRRRFGVTPAVLVEDLRLEEARLLMSGPWRGLAGVAHAVGFRSEDVFRRAFLRRYGVNPSTYNSRFSGPPTASSGNGAHHDAQQDRP